MTMTKAQRNKQFSKNPLFILDSYYNEKDPIDEWVLDDPRIVKPKLTREQIEWQRSRGMR